MGKYCCNDCKERFDEPKIYYEHYPYGSTNVEVEFWECPYCGSPDVEEYYLGFDEEDKDD